MMLWQNAAVVPVPAQIRHLRRDHRPLHRRLAEAVGRGPGNRRGVPN